MSTHIEVSAAATRFQRERWEEELRQIEARIDNLKLNHRPVRAEIERLGKRKMELMRKMGML